MDSKSMVSALLESYETIMKSKGNNPKWAVHKRNAPNELVKCTIPFVGKNYANQAKKILVYASAENLSDHYPGSKKERLYLDGDDAINRHRMFFDNSVAEIKEGEINFPNMHIQPINDGTLATAILYLASRDMDIHDMTPKMFCETIAVANYCKYTINTERQENIQKGAGNYGSDKNIDYTQLTKSKAREYLCESHPFLKAELNILKPDIIVMPESLFYIDKNFIGECANSIGAEIKPIYQLGPIPINIVIPKLMAKANMQKKAIDDLHPTIRRWHENIKRVSQDKYLFVYTYLDQK